MVNSIPIVIQAAKFGYTRYGPRGAVASAIAVGGSYLLIMRVIPRYTNVNEERVEDIYEKISDDEELTEILGEEFSKRFGKYVDGSKNEK